MATNTSTPGDAGDTKKQKVNGLTARVTHTEELLAQKQIFMDLYLAAQSKYFQHLQKHPECQWSHIAQSGLGANYIAQHEEDDAALDSADKTRAWMYKEMRHVYHSVGWLKEPVLSRGVELTRAYWMCDVLLDDDIMNCMLQLSAGPPATLQQTAIYRGVFKIMLSKQLRDYPEPLDSATREEWLVCLLELHQACDQACDMSIGATQLFVQGVMGYQTVKGSCEQLQDIY